jgi:hypothetical protein
VVLAAAGCDVDEGVEGDPSFRGEVENAVALNGAALNGVQFQGLSLNGVQFQGVQFQGVQFQGVQFQGVQFQGSSFSGTLGGVARSGADFEGAELLLTVNGRPHTLRFDDIYRDPARPDGDVWFYRVSVRDDAAGTWTSLCKDANGAPAAAIPVADHWNLATGARVDAPNVVTFACRGGVIAKCIEWGYVPWHSAVRCSGPSCATISLKDHHQACTRMARADYCGDGRSYTFDGTPIDIYDRLQTRRQTRSTLGHSNWFPEAEWGPNGATCVADELRLKMFDDWSIPYTFPGCLDAIDDISDCGALPTTRPGSLVADAYCYKWTDDPSECESEHP